MHRWRILLAAACALLLRVGYGDALNEECQKRDTWCSHRTFVWDVVIDVSWHLSRAERAMLESSGREAPAPSQRRLEGYLVVSRSPHLTYVGYAQARSTLPEQAGRFDYWFGKNFVVLFPQAANAAQMPSSAFVLPAPGDALYMGTLLPPTVDELTQMIHPSFVAGADPLRTFAPASVFRWRRGKWHQSEQGGNLVVFRLVGISDVAAELSLDASRGFAPASFVARMGTSRLEYTVSDWQSVDGWWLPRRVEVKQTDNSSARVAILTLRQVQESPTAMRIELPHGTSMADLRDIPPDMIATSGLLFVQGTTYHYAWTGRLPEKGVLPAVGFTTAQPFTMVGPPRPTASYSSFPLWQILAAVLLIVLGGIWYWRLRRAEGRG